MNEVFIYHHLGLGDHIMLNGLVRHFSESHDRTWLFCKPHNAHNVKQMFRDDKSIILNPFDDEGVRRYIQMFPKNKYVIVGHTPEFHRRINEEENKTFDRLFFKDQNVPFEYKWDKFYYERDIEREKEVYYDILGLTEDSEFIFIHESNYDPVTKQIPKNIQIIRPDNKDVGLFDYLYTIEKAKEVHVMNSSFMNLIDCIQLRKDNLYYHEYARPNINVVLRLPWNVIK